MAKMFSASSKTKTLGFYLAASIFIFSPAVLRADTGIVSAIGTGRDSNEAIVSLLKNSVTKHFRSEPANLSKQILQSEILTNATSFVQSYKVIEGGKGGAVSLSANIDLDVIGALFQLTPAKLGEENAKALVLVRGPKIPESMAAAPKPGSEAVNPFLVVENGAKERLARRGFEVIVIRPSDLQELGVGDEQVSPELMRGLATKNGARLAIGVSARYETFENENSHNKDERIVLNASLVDAKTGAVSKSTATVANPKSRKDQYIADLQRSLLEDSKDLFQDVLVAGGRKTMKTDDRAAFSIVRIESPSNPGLVNKFRVLLEGVKGVKSVVEYSMTRGYFALAVSPPLETAALVEGVKGMASNEEVAVAVLQNKGESEEDQPAKLVVKLSPKLPAENLDPNAGGN